MRNRAKDQSGRVSRQLESYEGSTFYFDLTDILMYACHRHDTVSGIQRFCLRLVGHLTAEYGNNNIRLIGWNWQHGKLYELNNDWCIPDYVFSSDDFCRWFGVNRLITISQWVKHYDGRPLRKIYHTCRASIFRVLRRASFFERNGITTSREVPIVPGTKLQPSNLKEGDAIIILGGVWDSDDYVDRLSALKVQGVKLFVFIHDLIPLLAPQYTSAGLAQRFSRWFNRISALADGFFVNSSATWNDLKSELRARGKDPPVGLVPLAHEFVAGGASSDDERQGVLVREHVRAAARRSFVLFVGTIEPRKNPVGVALVWQRLIHEFGEHAPRLVFAGSLGWSYRDFYELMSTSGQLSGFATFVDRPTDRELAYLYSNCLFTVYPSFYEGWGLPVGESLWFGRTVLTSNTSSMPEVGGDMCCYANPYDLDDIYEKVKKLIFDGDFRSDLEKRIIRDRLRTWSQVAEDMWKGLNAQTPPFPRP